MSTNSASPMYRMAVGVAQVAAVAAFVTGAVLLYDYSRRQGKDPFEVEAIKAVKAAVVQQPGDEELKKQLRRLDLRVREEYFRQRAFTATGTVALLVSVAVFLAAATWAAALLVVLPQPSPQVTFHDPEPAAMLLARWAVVALAVVLVGGAGVVFAVSVLARPPMPQSAEELAASLGAQQPDDGDTGVPAKPVVGRWPCFRGPGGLGVSEYTNVPESWDATTGKNIVWKTPVPLPGNNSPVLWDNRVFLSGADEKRREVYCFDAAEGTLLWRQPVPGTPESTSKPPKVNNDTGYAAPTTTTEGRRVFAMFANGDIAALNFDGKLAWARSLGMPENSYGHASSLTTYKNLVLVQFDQATAEDKKSKLFALDATTGKTAWQIGRAVPNSWTTPIVIQAAGRDQLITAADPWVIAYNPENGQEYWRARCLRQDVGPSPTFADGTVYVANQFPCLSAIRADGTGEVTKTHVLWKGEDGMPDTCSPLATKQYVFLLASEGTLTCYDAKQGDMLWQQDFEGITFTSSPSLVGSRLYLIANEGKCFVVEPGPTEAKIVAEGNLGEKCVTSPAFADGRIYLRGETHLICIGEK